MSDAYDKPELTPEADEAIAPVGDAPEDAAVEAGASAAAQGDEIAPATVEVSDPDDTNAAAGKFAAATGKLAAAQSKAVSKSGAQASDSEPGEDDSDSAIAGSAAATPAAPAPAPRRRRERPAADLEGVEVRAQARYVRTSARKARLVCDHIRGKDVAEARAILAFAPRAVARDWAKLLESAIANAEHNHELVGDDLKVASVYADEGPTLKRFRPRAKGRATRIRKRTSHLTITLTPKESGR